MPRSLAQPADLRDPATPLSLPAIEGVPKRVSIASDWYQKPLSHQDEDDVIDIWRLIIEGGPLTSYYKASRRADTLLRVKPGLFNADDYVMGFDVARAVGAIPLA